MNVHKEIENSRFAITGELSRFVRKQAINLIEDKGGIVEGFVTHKTDYLVVGAVRYETRKMKTAERYSTTILQENEFYEMLNLDGIYTQIPIQESFFDICNV